MISINDETLLLVGAVVVCGVKEMFEIYDICNENLSPLNVDAS